MAQSVQHDHSSSRIIHVVKGICCQLSASKGLEWNKISICKRSRDLKDGEFVIPKGSTPKAIEETPSVLLEYLQSQLPCLCSVDLPVTCVDSDKYNHARLHVDRPNGFSNIIRQVGERGDNYGNCPHRSSHPTMLNPSDLLCINDDDFVATPAHLRYLIVLQHVKHLLSANGYLSHQVPVARSTKLCDISASLGLDSCQSAAEVSEDENRCHDILSKLRESQYTEQLVSLTKQKGDSEDVDASSDRQHAVVINLRHFMDDNNIEAGKTGYDKNLSLVDVCHEDGPTDNVLHISRLQEFVSQKMESAVQMIHLVTETRAFTQQQTDLLWRIAGVDGLVGQTHFVLGSVTGRSGQPCSKTAQEFIQLRLDQMREASIMKYGDEVQGEGWETTLSGMSSASIAFEMLTTASRNSVKLDLSDEDRMGAENRAGAFVMYNCARLSTLFTHFEDAVKKGIYPPLPSIEDVTFEHLKQEEEWELLFNYIYPYPDVVEQCVEKLAPSTGDIQARIHTHKISNFLISFSRCLSSYYSRVHILGDGRPHLLPLMYARLHLIRAAHQVIKNGLNLMGIQPFSQL
ncbi:DALR anticodon-binding domain-containing protein 3-like isoform X2 [Haliotis rubra]|uniref:DALR anticodon-binding domain-containing protein 3-like isoform X2 n=1 Tax=Haliotis rubra TaxID=36100 RepID=UPI001EE50395|nr:DALR anticodon-binding domain-containing protein 3-like isoform X2 [Haliotis rubra]